MGNSFQKAVSINMGTLWWLIHWYLYARIKKHFQDHYLVREVFDRLLVDRQNDVSLSQKAALQCRLAREQTFDANHAAAVRPRVQLRNVEAEAEARQALFEDHLMCVF